MPIPSWVENPENYCTTKTSPTKDQLKSAMDFIKFKTLTSEKLLQTVANFVLPRLIAESFSDLKFEMQYSYVSQLNYLRCKEDDFLPTNFNNSAGNGKADVAILIVLPNKKEISYLRWRIENKSSLSRTFIFNKSNRREERLFPTVQLHADCAASM